MRDVDIIPNNLLITLTIEELKGSHHKRDAHEEIVTNHTTSSNFFMKFDIRLLHAVL